MTTAKHTPIAFGAARSAAVLNAPLGQLDAAILAVEAGVAQSALPIAVLTGSAASGQKILPYTGAPGSFIVGQPIWIGDIAGLYEVGVIASIQAGVSLTVVSNLTNTYAAGKIVSGSPAELVQARGAYATVSARLAATGFASGTVFPGSPAAGDLFRVTTRGGALYRWTGSVWAQLDVPAVTAFWGTPSTDDRCYRTDRGIEYFYDGTRWLSTTVYEVPLPHSPDTVIPITGNTTGALVAGIPWATAYDLWLLSLQTTFIVNTTNNATNYWTMVVQKMAGGIATTAGQFDTSGAAADSWTFGSSAINALLGVTHHWFRMNATKTLTPGALQFLMSIRYRLVG